MVLDHTKSMCPKCLKIIDAEIIEKEGRLYLHKRCDMHGMFETVHVFDAPEIYLNMKKIFDSFDKPVYPRDLILYVTSKCDQRCPMCYMRIDANEGDGVKDFSIGEILKSIANYKGEYVLLSGGEPALRDDLSKIIAVLKKKRFKVGLFTNGKKLRDAEYLQSLKHAGLDLVILQFDSLDDSHQEIIRGEKLSGIKMEAVKNLKRAGIWGYLFCILLEGINTNQVGRLFEYSIENIEAIKILNFNPVWQLGRHSGFSRISYSRILEEIEKQTSLCTDDFIICTRFALYFFELYRKLIGKIWVRQPACALRCYVLKLGPKLVRPLNKIINLSGINLYLETINGMLNSKYKVKNWAIFLIKFPYWFFIKEIFFNLELWKFFQKTAMESFISLFKGRPIKEIFKSMGIMSVMVGIFHNKYNIDLQIVKACTLYANLIDGKGSAPACIRHIYDDERKLAGIN